MLLSFVVYSFLGLSLFYLGLRANMREERLRQMTGTTTVLYSWEILLSILLITVAAALRYNTGFDYAMYYKQYYLMNSTGDFGRTNFEPGFYLVAKAFTSIGASHIFFFGFWAFLQALFLYWGLNDRKHLLPLVGLNIVLGPYFIIWMNSMRQSVVSCLFVLLVILIEQRKFWPYFIAVVVASSIHKSALLLVPLYFMGHVQIYFKDRRIYIAIVTACVLLGLKAFWFPALAYFAGFLKLINYEEYTDIVNEMLAGHYKTTMWGTSRIGLLLIDLCFIWFYNDIRDFFADDKRLPIYFNFAFVGVCFENILINTDGFMLRPTQYLLIFVLVMNAYCMIFLWKSGKRFICAGLASITFSYIYLEIIKAVLWPNNLNFQVLYNFCFLQ